MQFNLDVSDSVECTTRWASGFPARHRMQSARVEKITGPWACVLISEHNVEILL